MSRLFEIGAFSLIILNTNQLSKFSVRKSKNGITGSTQDLFMHMWYAKIRIQVSGLLKPLLDVRLYVKLNKKYSQWFARENDEELLLQTATSLRCLINFPWRKSQTVFKIYLISGADWKKDGGALEHLAFVTGALSWSTGSSRVTKCFTQIRERPESKQRNKTSKILVQFIYRKCSNL